ncbi:MAG: PEGA domain-containing protein [Lachnospiraceae bacterium]|nr:PEGA domain-containing protein [Lachnospiraceae bacterium]
MNRSDTWKRAVMVLALSLVLVTGCSAGGQSGMQSGQQAGGQSGQQGSGQAGQTQNAGQSRVDTGFQVTTPESYDSVDTAILVKKDKKEGKVTFLNLNRGRTYTLSFDGTTHLYDKYGESVSLEQIAVGDLVDVTFLKGTKHLTSMKLSSQAWKNEDVSRYEINYVKSEVTIGEDVYKLSDNTQYVSMGKTVDKMDLNPSDVLDFQGIDKQVLSVSVSKGHGYLRLLNDENFVGGWIEIGQSTIKQITDDMLLTLPEGSYQVNISHRGGGGVKNVTIRRNQETALDIGDLEVVAPQMGMLLFSVSPASAQVYIDGTVTDVSEPVNLEYGIHQMIVKADGYKSITQYLRVGQASAGVNVALETLGNGEAENKDVTDVSSNYYKVHLDAPEGAEAYVDGNYVGVVPCSFKKESGAHVLTLRRTGYTTRSYTIQVDEEEKDISFSFADLEVAEGTVSDGNS